MSGPQADLPIQPVDKPILCSPYKEPDQHRLYNRSTGIPRKEPGRRAASYWFESDRTGNAQQKLAFMTQEESDDLPLVNALREDVRRWRDGGRRGASETTKTLQRHWSREDRFRRLFFCRIEAAETLMGPAEARARAARLGAET